MSSKNGKGGVRSSTLDLTRSKRKMTFLGFALGLALVGLAVSIDIIGNDLGFDRHSIETIYRQNYTHIIILTSPFFLSAVFFVMGKMVGEREDVIAQQLKHEQSQFLIVEDFISKLENGNFDTDISADFKNQNLGAQLLRFKQKLVAEKTNEEKRSWENRGLASFGELLRKENDTERLSLEVLRFLIKHLACNQGSVFLIDNDGTNLDLKSCYAYDKKKYVAKSIPVGEGMVGQCYLEKQTMLLLQVPNDYIKITSGLGYATPNCVVITPLVSTDKVVGVIELASFDRLEKYQVDFLEKCAQAFATVVESVSVNQNVQNLLEQSQQQMEELRTQEEQMRQNLEELETIQEQMARQLEENIQIKDLLEARESVLAQTTILSESDLHGTITFVNPKFIEVSGFSSDELIGKGHNVVRHPDMPKALFKIMWNTIKSGRPFRGIVKNRKKNGGHYWVDATIVPIFQNGTIIKYIGARYHIQNEEMAELLFEQQLERVGIGNAVVAQCE